MAGWLPAHMPTAAHKCSLAPLATVRSLSLCVLKRCPVAHRPARSPTWHVVVGSNYGCQVVHATKNFIYFYLGPKAILIFKSG